MVYGNPCTWANDDLITHPNASVTMVLLAHW